MKITNEAIAAREQTIRDREADRRRRAEAQAAEWATKHAEEERSRPSSSIGEAVSKFWAAGEDPTAGVPTAGAPASATPAAAPGAEDPEVAALHAVSADLRDALRAVRGKA